MENGSIKERFSVHDHIHAIAGRLGNATKKLAPPFNTLVVSVVEIIAAIAASVLVARYLGVEGMGHFVLAFTIAQILSMAVIFGTHDIAIRMYATKVAEPSKILGASLWILVVGDGVCIVAAVLLCIFLPLSWFQILIVMLAIVVMLINGLGSIFTQAVVAYDMSHFDVRAIVVVRALQTAGLVFALEYGNLMYVMFVYILAAILLAGFRALIVHRKCFAIKPIFDSGVRRTLWGSAWKVGLGTVFGTISARSDVLILECITSTEVVGIYGAAYRVVNGALTGISAVASALFPMIAKAIKSGQRTLEMKLFLALPVLISIVFCVGAVFAAEPIVNLLYGPEFEPAIVVLQVLMIVGALYSITEFIGRYLVAAGNERQLPKAQGLGAGINIVLNILLIPSLGALGAALATVGSCSATLGYFLLLIMIGRSRKPDKNSKLIGSHP